MASVIPREKERVTLTRKQMEIAKLLGNPNLKKCQIQAMLGVSSATIAATELKLRSVELPECQRELEQYRTLIRKQMPDTDRVGALRKVMGKADSNPFAALRAVEYADKALGLVENKQNEQDTPETRPMFNLPSGCNVTVNLNMQPRPQGVVVEGQNGMLGHGATIDVTPQIPENTQDSNSASDKRYYVNSEADNGSK